MGILKNNRKYILERPELENSYSFICDESSKKHLLIIGESGNGKTQLIREIMKKVSTTPIFDDFVYLHFDAKLFDSTCSRETLYNMFIYVALQSKEYDNTNHTRLGEGETFLSFMENRNFKEDVKRNIKKTLISSLTLIPQIGNLIYSILNVPLTDKIQHDYVDNQMYFFQYIQYIADKCGCFFIIDNAQNISNPILLQLYGHLNQISNNIYLITSHTIKDDKMIAHKDIIDNTCFDDVCPLLVKSLTIDEFELLSEKNLDLNTFSKVHNKVDYYYALTQNGNLRQVDEFFFRINNYGLDNVTDIPTFQSIIDMDEIKKDIIDLTSIFSNGIKQSFIEKIVRQHCSCSRKDVIVSLASLSENQYIVEDNNNIFKIEHDKISETSKEILGIPVEEERFTELIYTCERIFTEMAYQDIDDVDFIFCINAIMEIVKNFNLMKHIGLISKYISLLHSACFFSQICNIYSRIREISLQNGADTILLFPISSIMKILDAHQKTSSFADGIEIVLTINKYYNVNLYYAKFMLQTYNYDEALNALSGQKNSYEAWSIYLNILQHMRKDDEVYNEVCNVIKKKFEFDDIEYYYVILRNSGHLFKPTEAKENILESLKYFQSKGIEFAESTCFNNIGIIQLYEDPYNCTSISSARDHFNRANKIMKRLDSNEEYQSLFNIGVSYACEHKYSIAIEYHKKAKRLIQGSLSFDIYKVECNITLCKFLNKEINAQECIDQLIERYVDVGNVPDKWLQLQYDYNIEALKSYIYSTKPHSLQQSYSGNMNVYGLFLDIPYEEKNIKFLFAISPHWRY